MDSSRSSSSSESQEYEVEKIVEVVKIDGNEMFRVRWRGYSPGQDTFEPRRNIRDCVAFERFLQERKRLREKEKDEEKGKKVARIADDEISAEEKVGGKDSWLAQLIAIFQDPSLETRGDAPQPRGMKRRLVMESDDEDQARNDKIPKTEPTPSRPALREYPEKWQNYGIACIKRGFNIEKVFGLVQSGGVMFAVVGWMERREIDVVPHQFLVECNPMKLIEFAEESGQFQN